MSDRTIASALVLVGLCVVPPRLAADELAVTLRPDRVVGRIDEKVYGHFLEHIYHSCNGGLWGELVWNRSFEENEAGQWSADDGCVVQSGLGTNQRLAFGDPAWSDYEFTLEARKTGGAEGFLILFRVKNDRDFYWCNLGGWGNTFHSLERGRSGEGRWHTVGPRVDGRIESDRWYRIKVRCEGSRIDVLLDDKPLIQFTDPAGHLTGAVGVGTWATQARFRNLKVASLDGKVLFEGLPEAVTRPAVARHWQTFGPCQAYIEQDRPLNGRYSQKLIAQGGEKAGPCGLRQSPFCLRKGETYAGSLWVRGSAPGGLAVRLCDGDSVLAEQKLAAPSDSWQEFPLSMPVNADAPDASLQIVLAGQGEVWIDQVSLMPQSWAAAGGFRPDLLEAIAALRPPVIRWPGGCFASAYRWKDAIGPQSKRGVYPRPIWDDLEVNSLGTDEFVALCRRVGAEPLIVVNIGTPNWNGPGREAEFLQEVEDWIQYCNGPADSTWGRLRAANGHPEPYNVRYWEIDNETWHMGAEAYAGAVLRFAPAMKAVDPSIKLAACGSAGYGREGIGLAWNRTIIQRCAKLIDYLSIHHYEDPNRFADGPRLYEAFFGETARLIAASENPKLKIDVSEWNAQSTDWRTGLYCGGLLNAFERCGGSLEIGGPALFLRHVSADAWDNAFINFDHRAWFPAPNYVVMKLWRDHYAPQRIALEGDLGPLNAVATRSADGQTVCLKAVNPSDRPLDIAITLPETFPVARAGLELVAPDSLAARNSLASPNRVAPVPGQLERQGQTLQVRLPRWSAAVVEIGQ